uniref:Acyl-protein thioesterase 1 n=1 Tax=Mycena chlorophos TaxID=658473 RepID=A0ABQ0LKN0_MYCCL|nr:acyl-protein thioesterase 1 [Mycena chlorophos]
MAGIAPLKSYIVPAVTKHTATVIFVHGLGDTGLGWKPVAEMLNDELPQVKWVLPNAPPMPVTANGERKLAGLTVLSGWLPLRHDFKSMISEHAKSLPIFWGHGSADPLVRHELAVKSVDFLRESIGINTSPTAEQLVGLSFTSYAGVQHSVNDRELSDLKTWLKKVLPSVD